MLAYGRWLGYPLAMVLVIVGAATIVSPPAPPAWFFVIRGSVEIALATLLLIPYQGLRVHSRLWWWCFGSLALGSVIFVFLRVIGVLFEAIQLEEQGERVGLPAFSGTLVFLVLLQLPIIFFRKHPDQMN